MKYCPKCKENKLLERFHTCNKNKDKKQNYCIDCRNIIQREYKRKKWATDPIFKEKTRAMAERSRLKRKLNNPEAKIQYDKAYSIKNKEKIRINHKKWRDKNRNYVRNYWNDYSKRRKRNEPNFKLKHNLRLRIYNALRAVAIYSKAYHTMELLGCKIDFFKNYLEKQFKPGMNWENYGKIWHVDHIKPCKEFDLTKEEEQKKCFHYINLRPLWATTKIAKEYGDTKTIGNINRNAILTNRTCGSEF